LARRLRLQYAGAIYHLLARGNGRQEIVREDLDRGRFQEDLGKAAIRRSSRGSDRNRSQK
jgi:putative transposase